MAEARRNSAFRTALEEAKLSLTVIAEMPLAEQDDFHAINMRAVAKRGLTHIRRALSAVPTHDPAAEAKRRMASARVENDATPGPWHACHDGECACGFIWDATGEVHVASAHDASATGSDWIGSDTLPTPATRWANARLIAAAPTMLAALRLVPFSTEWACMEADTQDAVLDAIAKAEG